MKSIAEITQIEEAHTLGVKSLGVAADALIERWKYGLRDNETFIRLTFLSWYSRNEPGWHTGLGDVVVMPAADELVSNLGGTDFISPESLFILSALATGFPCCLGDEAVWKVHAASLPERVLKAEPRSLVFRNWSFLFGLAKGPIDPLLHIKAECHARFHGRGYMGTYIASVFARVL